tara:strand:- start:362 stop:1462 length:1101 start_codon:yes stop_codon:yes gene_type:complete
MNFKILKSSLAEPLSLLASVAESRQSIPILSNIYIKAENEEITLIATDLEIELSFNVKCKDIKENGETTVSARKIFDLTRSLSEDTALEFSLKDNQLIVTALKFNGEFAILPIQDFPVVEIEKFDLETKIKGNMLADLIDQTSFAMASQDVRYYLNGILIEIEGAKVNLVATDGHRLAWATETLDAELNENKLILPRKSAIELQKLLNLFPGEVNLCFSTNQILISSDNFRFVSKLIEGNYPDYQKVFPKGEEQTLKVEKSLMQTALSRASVLSNEKYRGVKFILSKDNLRICANNPSKESAEEEIAVDYSGDELEIGFNISYIQESLSVINNPEVEFVFFGSENSCIIKNNKNDNLVHVIMPMRL